MRTYFIQGINSSGLMFIVKEYFDNPVDAYDYLCDNYSLLEIDSLKLRVITAEEMQ